VIPLLVAPPKQWLCISNPYVTRELLFEFHYFFMRKLWFAHLARALVAFPGGFGTLDELRSEHGRSF
jgi:predicted Rossmann-fold nucleotide-binding protein